MSKEISADQVREGDKIRVTREFTVTAEVGRRGAGYEFLVSEYPGIRAFVPPEATIQLLDRPVNLPTEPGTVVLVRTGDLDEALSYPGHYGRWFLSGEGPTSTWTSRVGIRKNPAQFKEFLQERDDRTFEVVA